MKLIAVNARGYRMGESHGRAKLTDEDVDLVVSLLECREALVTEYSKVGLSMGQIGRALHKAQLSYAGIADKFEVSKSLIKAIADGKVRGCKAVNWRRAGACT